MNKRKPIEKYLEMGGGDGGGYLAEKHLLDDDELIRLDHTQELLDLEATHKHQIKKAAAELQRLYTCLSNTLQSRLAQGILDRLPPEHRSFL